MSNQPTYSHLSSHEVEEVPFMEGEVVTSKRTTITKRLNGDSVVNHSNHYAGQMIAPATLPEGYELPVKLGSSQFNIQVPTGGVEEGQVFAVSIPQATITNPSSSSILPPIGAWRDGICDCFSYGVCHSHCVTSCCCPLCKLRLQLRATI